MANNTGYAFEGIDKIYIREIKSDDPQRPTDPTKISDIIPSEGWKTLGCVDGDNFSISPASYNEVVYTNLNCDIEVDKRRYLSEPASIETTLVRGDVEKFYEIFGGKLIEDGDMKGRINLSSGAAAAGTTYMMLIYPKSGTTWFWKEVKITYDTTLPDGAQSRGGIGVNIQLLGETEQFQGVNEPNQEGKIPNLLPAPNPPDGGGKSPSPAPIKR